MENLFRDADGDPDCDSLLTADLDEIRTFTLLSAAYDTKKPPFTGEFATDKISPTP